MYVTKLCLNPRSRRARADLANAYEMHRTLLRAVTEEQAAASERLLWRLEPGRPDRPTVLVQTRAAPRWKDVLDKHPHYAKIYTPKQDLREFHVGQALRFRLKANASVKREGKRHALRTPDEKLTWMKRQATGNGFGVDAAAMVATERLLARKNGTRITLDATLFEGVLRVTDPARAREATSRGIGHAKGFGLGMLSVAAAGGT